MPWGVECDERNVGLYASLLLYGNGPAAHWSWAYLTFVLIEGLDVSRCLLFRGLILFTTASLLLTNQVCCIIPTSPHMLILDTSVDSARLLI